MIVNYLSHDILLTRSDVCVITLSIGFREGSKYVTREIVAVLSPQVISTLC